jgi:hypothetical protein
MSVAVGAFFTGTSPLPGTASVSSSRGLPSTVPTEVGWYCSAEVWQGGSVCLRSIRIGA